MENKVNTLNFHISEAEQVANLLELTVRLKRHIKARDYAALMKELNEYKAQHEFKISELNTEIATLGIEIDTLSKTQKTLTNEKTTLNQGLPSYKEEINALIDVIKSNITDEQGNSIKVTPLCECLEIAEGQEVLYPCEGLYPDWQAESLRGFQQDYNGKVQEIGTGLEEISKIFMNLPAFR